MSNRLGGLQGTAYVGTNANQPPNWAFEERNPNIYDTNYSLGDLWLNTVEKTTWVLVSLRGTTTSKGMLAKWCQFGCITPPTLTYFLNADMAQRTGDSTTVRIVYNTPLNTPTLTGYDPTTGLFTAPEDGTYSVNTAVCLTGITPGMDFGRLDFGLTGTGPDVGNIGWAMCVFNASNLNAGILGMDLIRVNASNIYNMHQGDQLSVLTAVGNAAQVVNISRGLVGPTETPSGTWLKITKLF